MQPCGLCFSSPFFTFSLKSNLVPDVADRISTKGPLRADLEFSSKGASLHIKASKTIQYQQRSLSIPLPCIPGSPLCPVTPLRLNPAHHSLHNFRRGGEFRLSVLCSGGTYSAARWLAKWRLSSLSRNVLRSTETSSKFHDRRDSSFISKFSLACLFFNSYIYIPKYIIFVAL